MQLQSGVHAVGYTLHFALVNVSAWGFQLSPYRFLHRKRLCTRPEWEQCQSVRTQLQEQNALILGCFASSLASKDSACIKECGSRQ